jgi:hypothetical protein
MSIDRQPACLYYCEGQCLRKKVVPGDRAGDGGILGRREFVTASIELQPVADQGHAVAQAVLGKT